MVKSAVLESDSWILMGAHQLLARWLQYITSPLYVCFPVSKLGKLCQRLASFSPNPIHVHSGHRLGLYVVASLAVYCGRMALAIRIRTDVMDATFRSGPTNLPSDTPHSFFLVCWINTKDIADNFMVPGQNRATGLKESLNLCKIMRKTCQVRPSTLNCIQK